MAKKKGKKYSFSERRAYWVGVGYEAGVHMGMSASQLKSSMKEREKDSFNNGAFFASDVSSKFLPDRVAGSSTERKKKSVKKGLSNEEVCRRNAEQKARFEKWYQNSYEKQVDDYVDSWFNWGSKE